jgi:hypothetical protein
MRRKIVLLSMISLALVMLLNSVPALAKDPRDCYLDNDYSWSKVYDGSYATTSCYVTSGGGDMDFQMNVNGGGWNPISTPDYETDPSTYDYNCTFTNDPDYEDCTASNELIISKAPRDCLLTNGDDWDKVWDSFASETYCSPSIGEGDGILSFVRNTEDISGVSQPDRVSTAGEYDYSCGWSEGTYYLECFASNVLYIDKSPKTCELTTSSVWSKPFDNVPVTVTGGVQAGACADYDPVECQLHYQGSVVGNPDYETTVTDGWYYVYCSEGVDCLNCESDPYQYFEITKADQDYDAYATSPIGYPVPMDYYFTIDDSLGGSSDCTYQMSISGCGTEYFASGSMSRFDLAYYTDTNVYPPCDSYDFHVSNEDCTNYNPMDSHVYVDVEPVLVGCAELNVSGMTYYLEDDIIDAEPESGICIDVTADDIVLDCQGHTIDGVSDSDTYGVASISSPYTSNFTLKNCVLQEWYYNAYDSGDYTNYSNVTSKDADVGFYLEGSNTNLEFITSSGSYDSGVLINGISYVTITNFSSDSDYVGIDAESGSSDISLTNITIANGDYYCILFYTTTDVEMNNIYIDTCPNGAVYGGEADDWNIYNIESYNTGLEFGDASYVKIDGCVIDDSDSVYPINFWSSSSYNNIVENCIISNSEGGGIYMENAFNTWLENLTFEYNDEYSFDLETMSNVTVKNVTTSNVYRAFYLADVSTGILDNLNLEGSGVGILAGGSSDVVINNSRISFESEGIGMENSNNHDWIIDNTNITGGEYGIYVGSSSNMVLVNSRVINSDTGIKFDSENAYISTFYNDLFNNSLNFDFDLSNTEHVWNTTRQSGTRIIYAVNFSEIGGNYYSNFEGTGYSDACTDNNKDGFCDIPYELASYDYLPLSNPATPLNCNVTSCQDLDNACSVWTMTADIIDSGSSACMNIISDNETLDCQGHTIAGLLDGYTYGVYNAFANFTLLNCVVQEWDANIYDEGTYSNYSNITSSGSSDGFYLLGSDTNLEFITSFDNVDAGIVAEGSSYVTVNGYISDNDDNGVHVESSSYITLINMDVSGSGVGAYFYDVSDGTVENSNFSDSTNYGMYFVSSAITVTGCRVENSATYGLYLDSLDLVIYNNLFNNTAEWLAEEEIWNTTRQSGTRIIYSENFSEIGGNYWTNPTGDGFSDTCSDNNADGFCDSAYDVAGGGGDSGYDYLPLTYNRVAYFENVTECKDLSLAGTYYLQNDITVADSYGYCFNILADDVVLDCQGFMIKGDSGYSGTGGVYSTGRNNIAIKNCNFDMLDPYEGIYVSNSDNINISDIIVGVLYSSQYGISLQGVNNSYVSGYSKDDFGNGINGNGIEVWGYYDTLDNNVIEEPSDYGLSLSDFYYGTVKNIILNTSDASGICLYLNGNHNNFYNLSFDCNGGGGEYNAYIEYSGYNSFYNITGGFQYDTIIYLDNIYNNTFSGLEVSPIFLRQSDNNTFVNLNLEGTTDYYGFSTRDSNNDIIKNSSITDFDRGIDFSPIGDSYDFYFDNVSLSDNNIGIYVGGESYFTLVNSKIVNSADYGLVFTSDEDMPSVFYNNLFNNTDNFNFGGSVIEHIWNTTEQSGTRIINSDVFSEIGGNYYATPSGTGYSETCSDSDNNSFCDDAFDVAGDGNNGYDYLPYSKLYEAPSNQPPSIYYMDSIPATDPVEGTTATILFNVSIDDPQGYADIAVANVSANMTGEIDRTGSCVAGDVINDTAINYSCSFDMQFYDSSGSWSVNVYAEDAGELSDSQWTSFTYNTLTAWDMAPHSIGFPETFASDTGVLALENTTMHNTGNADLVDIEMNSTDLVGVNFSETIVADNFTMNTAGACGGTGMSSNNFVQIGGATLARGNSSYASLYYCFENVPHIITDVYDTSMNGQWTLRSVG